MLVLGWQVYVNISKTKTFQFSQGGYVTYYVHCAKAKLTFVSNFLPSFLYESFPKYARLFFYKFPFQEELEIKQDSTKEYLGKLQYKVRGPTKNYGHDQKGEENTQIQENKFTL